MQARNRRTFVHRKFAPVIIASLVAKHIVIPIGAIRGIRSVHLAKTKIAEALESAAGSNE